MCVCVFLEDAFVRSFVRSFVNTHSIHSFFIRRLSTASTRGVQTARRTTRFLRSLDDDDDDDGWTRCSVAWTTTTTTTTT